MKKRRINLIKIKPLTVFISISIFLLFAYLFVSLKNNQSKTTQLIINNKTINVEIADTEAKREKGLSLHKPLSDRDGMLFVFNKPGFYSFWMKDMLFDLDFIWLNDNKIVEITENVSHNDQRKVYQPKTQVDKVLEVISGFVKVNNIQVGDQVEIMQNANLKM